MNIRVSPTKMEDIIPIILESLANEGTVHFSPKGTSMLPMLRQGIDSVVLSPLPAKLKKYDIPLYKRDNGQFVLHRIVKVDENYTCVGDNQFCLEKGIRHDQMIAVVTEFYRENRRISVNSLSYKVYCRLWHFSRPLRYVFRGATVRVIKLLKKTK